MRWDRVRNDKTQRRAGIEETVAEKVDRIVLLWFGHVERMDERLWPRKIKADKVEGQQGRRRPKFCWLDEMNGALAVRKER